jgi:PleD family two-component response regulator
LGSSLDIVAEQAAAYGVSVPPEQDSGDRYLSPNDIGKILNVTGMAVKQWLYRGKLQGVRLTNGFWKVRKEDFEAYLKARTAVHRSVVLISDSAGLGTHEIEAAADTLGYRALVANNASDALLKALEHMPILIAINVTPDDDACWKFAERVRAQKTLRNIPILLLAGKEISDAEAERAAGCGAQGLLARPLSTETLTQEMDRILKRAER